MNEPLRIDQIPGGCWPACLAGLTGIQHDALARHVPADFKPERDDVWREYRNAIVAELHAHGWTYVDCGTRIPKGWSVMVGRSERGVDHAVIAFDGALWHDPHPSRAGLVSVKCYELVIPIVGLVERAGVTADPPSDAVTGDVHAGPSTHEVSVTEKHRIQIISPTGLPNESKFLLDGKEMDDVCALRITVDPNEFIAVVTTVQPQSLALDVGGLIERTFVTENQAQKAIGEQHAQLVAEHASGYEPGSSSAKIWQEIAAVIFDLARRKREALAKASR